MRRSSMSREPLPTKRFRYRLRLGGWMYVLVMLFIGMAALHSQVNLLFWAFGLMASGLVLSAVAATWMLRGLQVQRLAPDHGAVGGEMAIVYRVANRRRLLPVFGLSLEELDVDGRLLRTPPRAWIMHVGPRSESRTEAVAACERRGALELDRLAVIADFPFGLLERSMIVGLPETVPIYPRIHRLHPQRLQQIGPTGLMGSRACGRSSGGQEEFYGLREHREGDGIKTIDWKRSARAGRLLSREMCRLTPPRFSILLDLRRDEQRPVQRDERAIALAASILCEALRARYEVGLVVAGVPVTAWPPVGGPQQRERLLRTLCAIDLSQAQQAVGEGASSIGPEQRWLVVHAGAIDPSLGPRSAARLSDLDLMAWRLGAASDAMEAEEPAWN